jgi:putative membrane protein
MTNRMTNRFDRRRLLTLPLAATLATGLAATATAQGLLERLAGTSLGATGFVQVATISNNFEIESSRLLLARSQHPQIREFAQRMIEHHTMLAAELAALPEATTRMPAALDERHGAMLATLRRQEEVDLLNRHFIEQQVEAHTETLAAYEAFAANGDVPALRAFAERHVGTIRQHLEMARALQAPQQRG